MMRMFLICNVGITLLYMLAHYVGKAIGIRKSSSFPSS